jgi:hypothetical protein
VSSLRVGSTLALCAALAAWPGASACGRFGYDTQALVDDGGPGAADAVTSSDSPVAASDAAADAAADAPPGTTDATTADAPTATGTAELAVTVGTTDGTDPTLAFTGDGYSIVWSDTRNANRELYLQRVAAGALQGAAVRLTSATGYSGFPAAAWSGTELALGWEDGRLGSDEVYFGRFDRNGGALSLQRPLSSAAGLAYDPAVVWNGTDFGVAWEDGGNVVSQIYVTHATGSVPVNPPVQRTSSARTSLIPSIAWSGSSYGIAWESDRTGTLQVYFARSDASGAAIGIDPPVLSSGGRALGASVAWNGSEFGVAYEDNRTGTTLIYLQLLQATGAVDGPAIPLTQGNTPSTQARLVWATDHWAVTYLNGGRIYLAEVSPVAPSMPVALPVSSPASDADSPDLVWTGSAYGVVWQDHRDGNWDVYFREVAP